jgi:hypothetical protein
MQFTSKEDIEAPISAVFAMLSEFEIHERSAIRRGIEVQRQDPTAPIAVGLIWNTRFAVRGKQRDVRLTLVDYEPPNSMQIDADSQGLDARFTVELVALSTNRTRLSAVLDLAPKTLSARLLVQSLKLTKSNLTKRFNLNVADYAKNLEDRHSRMT